MDTIFLDFELAVSQKMNIQTCTLQRYLAWADIRCVSWTVNDDPAIHLAFADANGDLPADVLALFRRAAESPDWTVVAHNIAFDMRVWHEKCQLPWPKHVRCSLEMACAAYPNQPGGHSLSNLAATLNTGVGPKLGEGKGVAGMMKMTAAELGVYCQQDTRLCRAIYYLCLARLHERELQVAEFTNAVREMTFEVDPAAVAAAMDEFGKVAAEGADEALAVFQSVMADGSEAFGRFENGAVKSVKPADMRSALLEAFGFDTPTISFKKMNPELLRSNPEAASALKGAEKVNKALHHQRNMRKYAGSTQMFAELGYFRAHTGRFSSPSTGKGLNLHNLPKRDKRLAGIVRPLFRLPSDLCFGRGDLSNVEYRVEGLLSGCEYVRKMFEADIFADPYASYWFEATGVRVSKSDSMRQVAKNCILGLGFLMGLYRWMCELAKAMADPTLKPPVTLKDLDDLCVAMRWGPPKDPWVKAAMAKARVPWQVASVAFHTRNLFHEIHPEFGRLARWLELATNQLAQCRSHDQAKRILDRLYAMTNAPKHELVELVWDDSFEGSTVRVRLGTWPAPTVTWRDLGVRVFDNGRCGMTFMNGKRGYWSLSPNLLIENVCQGAARNALCEGVLALRDRGYPYVLHVHDEIMPVCYSTPADVIKTKKDLLEVFGPYAMPGWEWAVVINPSEVNVSRSLYETECDANWWSQLPTHPELLEKLS